MISSWLEFGWSKIKSLLHEKKWSVALITRNCISEFNNSIQYAFSKQFLFVCSSCLASAQLSSSGCHWWKEMDSVQVGKDPQALPVMDVWLKWSYFKCNCQVKPIHRACCCTTHWHKTSCYTAWQCWQKYKHCNQCTTIYMITSIYRIKYHVNSILLNHSILLKSFWIARRI